MEKWIYFTVGMSLFISPVFAESQRKTTSDIFQEGYADQVEKRIGQGVSTIRADHYREEHEVCDPHHNCSSGEEKKIIPLQTVH